MGETVRSINGFYDLESMSVGGVELDVAVGIPVTLNLNAVDRTDMTGTGPCNEFFGEWSHSGGRLAITDWQTTDLDCPTEEAVHLETALFEVLGQRPFAEVDLDQTPPRLVMTGPDVTLVWIEVPTPEEQPTRPAPPDVTPTSIPGQTDPGSTDA
jgi:hypothetical protein